MRLRSLFSIVFVLAILGGTNANAEGRLCKGQEKTIAEATRYTANAQLDIAIGRLSRGEASTQTALRTWFGDSTPATRERAKELMLRAKIFLRNVAFFCQYQSDTDVIQQIILPSNQVIVINVAEQIYAYVDPTNFSRITLGLAFFGAPESGQRARFGTIYHEMTHFWIVGNTNAADDEIYGPQQCRELAQANPGRALRNAQNHRYFLEEISQ